MESSDNIDEPDTDPESIIDEDFESENVKFEDFIVDSRRSRNPSKVDQVIGDSSGFSVKKEESNVTSDDIQGTDVVPNCSSDLSIQEESNPTDDIHETDFIRNDSMTHQISI